METAINNKKTYPKINPTTPIDKRSIKFKTEKEKQELNSFVKNKLESLPIDIPFTITETFRTKEEYDNLKKSGYEVSLKYNDHSDAIDIRYDENGHQFIAWLQTDGLEWAKQNIKEVRAHGKGNTLHYHVVFK